jgi:small subunit ribosomal protein S6
MTNFYETTFIVNPNLDDHQIENTIKLAEDAIVKNGSQIVNTDRIGRKRLMYPIAKKHTGFYVCIEFEGEGKSVEKIERALKLEENVLRYLSLKLDKRELQAKRDRASARLALLEPAVEATVEAAAAVPAVAAPVEEKSEDVPAAE